MALWLDPALASRATTLLVDVDTNFTANYGTIKSRPLGAGPDWGKRPVRGICGIVAPKIDKLVVRLLTAAKPIALHFPRIRKH